MDSRVGGFRVRFNFWYIVVYIMCGSFNGVGSRYMVLFYANFMVGDIIR